MTNQTLTQSVVVFSHNYLPIHQVQTDSLQGRRNTAPRVLLKRAVILLVTGKAEPIDFIEGNNWRISSPSLTLLVPQYIRLFRSSEKFWRVPAVSRRELLKRDHYRCQYCGSKQQLTIDHVIPRSRGGTHTWDNLVIACASCNSRKGSRLLDEVGMKLATKPKAPIHPAVAFVEEFWQANKI